MSRPLLMMVLLLFRGPHSGSAEDGYDLKREIAWARSQWPEDLKGIHFHSPTAKLLDWVPRGRAIRVWMFAGSAACVPVELHRVSDGDGEALVGRHFISRQIRPIELSRMYTSVLIGSVFTESGDSCIEDLASGGPPECSGGIYVPDQIFGVLSQVSHDSARFDGEEIALHPECDGPIVWLPCKGGGKRPCDQCKRVSIFPTEAEGYFSGGGPITAEDWRRATCNEVCPAQPWSPTLARLEELERRTHIWRPRRQPLADVPSLHRTIDSCMRTHFPKGWPTETTP